jgi:hypothetical protein
MNICAAANTAILSAVLFWAGYNTSYYFFEGQLEEAAMNLVSGVIIGLMLFAMLVIA